MQDALTELFPTLSEVKHCRRCGETKPTSEFNRDKSKTDGLQSNCRACRDNIRLGHYERDPYAQARYSEKWKSKQPEPDITGNVRLQLMDMKMRYSDEIELITLEHRAMFYTEEARKNQRRLVNARWSKKNPDKLRQLSREWSQRNPEKKKDNRKRSRERLKDSPLHIAKKRIRCRTQKAFKRAGFKKVGSTAKMLGCTWPQLKKHIESQFTKGMTWTNRDQWHIDHVIPLASACSAEELARLAHWTNLKPMWAGDNMLKRDRIVTCQPELAMGYA